MLAHVAQHLRLRMSTGAGVTEPLFKVARTMSQEPALRVKRLSEHATLPVRGSAGAAGYDIARHARADAYLLLQSALSSCRLRHGSLEAFPPRSAHDTVVPARGKALVKTDLSVAIPEGTYARVAPRSGLALKHFIDTGAGVRRLRTGCARRSPLQRYTLCRVPALAPQLPRLLCVASGASR